MESEIAEIFVCVCVFLCARLCVYLYVFVRVCVLMRVCTDVCVYVRMCVCKYNTHNSQEINLNLNGLTYLQNDIIINCNKF